MKNHLAIRLFGDSVIRGTRQGSALLIVLGMVSFMIVSAVAFSMYMRTSRMPSSYLRRGAAARHLLRSALANAIDRLDGSWRCTLDSAIGYDIEEGYVEGVYDDLYPGLNPKGLSTQEADYPYTGNRFDHHVFSPFVSADPAVTVSTLTLEGLAYLPPALVNDVRLFSRRTLTARWCNLSYEFGRYAFCAVDVSDCFDVNKVRVSGRTSAAGQRIGFSNMFQKGSTWSDLDGSLATEFNTLANKFGDAGIPYVSMADFNVFNGKTSFTPFCRFVGQSGDLSFVSAGDTAANGALFTTDTWFPPTNMVTNVRRYSLESTQPFDVLPDGVDKSGVDEVLKDDVSSFGRTYMRDRLGGTAMVALRDYLDADSIPLSYALPTVETAPMVCALGLQAQGGGLKLSLGTGETREADLQVSDPKKKIRLKATARTLKLETEQLHLIGLAAFPFKRLKDKGYDKTSFTAKGLVKVFLAPANVQTRLDSHSPLLPKDKWSKSNDAGILTREVTMSGTISMGKDLPTQKEAVQSFEGDVDLSGAPSPTLFWEVVKTTTTLDKDGNPVGDPVVETYYSMDGVADNSATFTVYDEKGVVADWWTTLQKNVKPMFEKNAGTVAVEPTHHANGDADISAVKYVPHVAVWVKLQDGEDVVDIVPAYLGDDLTWGKRRDSENDEVTDACGASHPPILRFSPATTFGYGISAEKDLAGDGAFDWSVLFTVDPRYNYAPEAWYAPGDVEPTGLQSGDKWIDSLKGLLGQNGRDPDIFMFTSDQGYLQSMGELQFLPMVQDIPVGNKTPDMFPRWMTNLGTGKSGVTFPLKSAAAVLSVIPWAWRTYSAVDGDPIYNLGDSTIEVVSSRNDFRVNPYTRDERVFMTAIANTPYDWYVASTNEELNLFGKCDYRNGKPTADEAKKHAFNSKTPAAKWTDTVGDSELQDIAYALQDGFSAAAENWDGSIGHRPSWESAYDGLAWYDGKTGDEQKTFLGVNMDTVLHGVDRKFLHSFWRECFGNRQQLFLIFLRAEQLTVGGSGTAAMANAQTGARGVALVWRDPEPPAYERDKRPRRADVRNINQWKPNGKPPAPHRTRVLFYHQFD